MPGPKRTPATPASFLGQLDRQITTAERTLDEQERYVRGLRQAREIVAKEVLTNAFNGTNGRHRKSSTFNGSGSRSAMLRTILSSVSEPVTVDEIVAEMARHNVTDSKVNVRSTLSALKRAGEIKNPERGRWIGVTANQASKAA